MLIHNVLDTYEATRYIIFDHNFTVDLNTTFSAIIKSCPSN